MWTQKYSPKSLREFKGNQNSVRQILEWLNGWKKQNKKSLLIMGPQGTGKTTLIELIAKELNYNLIETNASDVRTAKMLKEGFGTTLQQKSLFYKGKLVLFDEIEGLSGKSDRGAAKEIQNIIELSKYPIFLTANEDTSSVKTLKKTSKVVKFNKVDNESTASILKDICNKEKIEYEEKALRFIVNTCGGDIKAAINDLQAMAEGKTKLTYEDIHDNFRDMKKSVEEVLTIIFKTLDAKIADQAMYDLEMPLDEFVHWVKENLPKEYTRSRDLAEAYNSISRADVFIGRIRRRQYWGFLPYVSKLSSVGVALSKINRYNNGAIRCDYPYTFGYLYRTQFQRVKEKELAKKLGGRLHCSTKVARQYFPLLKLMELNRPNEYIEFIDNL